MDTPTSDKVSTTQYQKDEESVTSLLRTRRILNVQRVDLLPDYITFAQFDEEGIADTTRLQVLREDWEAMGKPKQVTITIEPGDLLNVAPPDSASK